MEISASGSQHSNPIRFGRGYKPVQFFSMPFNCGIIIHAYPCKDSMDTRCYTMQSFWSQERFNGNPLQYHAINWFQERFNVILIAIPCNQVGSKNEFIPFATFQHLYPYSNKSVPGFKTAKSCCYIQPRLDS